MLIEMILVVVILLIFTSLQLCIALRGNMHFFVVPIIGLLVVVMAIVSSFDVEILDPNAKVLVQVLAPNAKVLACLL